MGGGGRVSTGSNSQVVSRCKKWVRDGLMSYCGVHHCIVVLDV